MKNDLFLYYIKNLLNIYITHVVERVTNKNQEHVRPNVDGTRLEILRAELVQQGQIDRTQGSRFLRSTIHRALALRPAIFAR